MLEDRNGTLWLATHGAGLLKFDRQQRRFIRYRNDPGDPNSLRPKRGLDLFTDREGSIWAGLGMDGGHPFFDEPSARLREFQHDFGSAEGIGEAYVNAHIRGSSRNPVDWYAPKHSIAIDRKPGHYTYSSDRRTSSRHRCDHDSRRPFRQSLGLGRTTTGCSASTERTGQFQTYRHNPADPYSLSNDVVTRLLVDHERNALGRHQGWSRIVSMRRPDASQFISLDPQRRRIDRYLNSSRTGRGTVAWHPLLRSPSFRSSHGSVHHLRTRHESSRDV